MQKRSDHRLVAYLDGELEPAEQREVDALLDSDPAVRDRLAALALSAKLVRRAFDDVLHEPLPDRLIAAAHGGQVAGAIGTQAVQSRWRAVVSRSPVWRVGLPIAASLAGLLAGGGSAYFGVAKFLPGGPGIALGRPAIEAAVADNLWLDNAAGYFKLFVSAGANSLIDVPATGDPRQALEKISQSLPQQVRLPDLKPWGLNFRGARLIVVDGRPAAQLVYTTNNKAIGPLALIIGSLNQPDIPPTFERRQDVNLIYWRHQGRAYALVGQANIGYLWGIGNDVAWQLDAI